MADFETRLTELQKHFLEIAGTISGTLLTEEDSLRYAKFTAYLEQINQMAENFVAPAEDGSFPVMDQMGLDAFKASYRRTIAACEEVLGENGNDGVSLQMKQLARETKKHLLQDLAAFESVTIREEEPLTMDQILELGSTLTVDIGNQEALGRGQALSERIPIRVPGAPGGDLDGFFTRTTRVDTAGDKKRLFDEQRKKYPEFAELLNAIETADHASLRENRFLDVTLAIAIRRHSRDVHKPTPTDKKTMGEYASSYYSEALENCVDRELVKRNAEKENFALCMSEVSQTLGAIVLRGGLYVTDKGHWLGTKEGSNIDKRNAAMSTVSTLLGKKGLIAEAKPMIVLMNGTPTSGTYMQSAPGYDAYDGKQDNPMRRLHSDAYNNPDIFDDVAALQAIDYICGNLDRHPGNFRCQFAEVNGSEKLVKIIGIDNDLSFGLLTPVDHPANRPLGKPYVLPKEMCALGEETARRIETMTRDQLALSLRGFDLSKEEIEAAWRRTEILQNAIREGREHYEGIPQGKIDKGFLRIVPEVDWAKYSLGKLAVENNQFRAIGQLRKSTLDRDKVHEIQNREKRKTEEAKEIIFGIPKQPKKEILPVTGIPTGNGLTYTVANSNPLNTEGPDTLRMVLPDGPDPDSVGGANNRRYAVEITDRDGNSREGFFTAAADVRGRSQIRNLIETYSREQEDAHPLWAEAIRRSATLFLQEGKYLREHPDYDLRDIGFPPETADALKQDLDFHVFYATFIQRVATIQDGYLTGYRSMGVSGDGSIEKRNVAFSRLSEALDCSGCVAHAEVMQLQKDGKVVDGIFMDRAEGKSIADFMPGDEEVRQGVHAFDGSMALKDLADIQVMDFLCMNIDRNNANLIFKYSEDGKKCLRVTGIDNDFSFGTIYVESDTKQLLDTPLDKIRVISESMAKRITDMTEISLRKAIGGQGINEAEYAAVRERFNRMRNKVKSGSIRIVKDDEWKDMTLEQLAERDTLFYRTKISFTTGMTHRMAQKEADLRNGQMEPPKELHFTKGEMVREFSEEARDVTQMEKAIGEREERLAEDLLDSALKRGKVSAFTDVELLEHLTVFADSYSRRVKEQDSVFHGKTTFFTNLMTAAEEFSQLIRTYRDIGRNGERLGEEDLDRLLTGMKTIRDRAQEYSAHVEDVRERTGSISRTQRKRAAMTEDLRRELNTVCRHMQRRMDEREAELHPDRRLYADLSKHQQKLASGELSNESSDRELARIIYLSGISRNVYKLAKDKKLILALKKEEVNRESGKILQDPAFHRILTEKGRDEVVRLACRENGEQLFTEYARSMAKADRKPKNPEQKAVVQKAPKL